ncbi:MAG: phosphoribosylformylglycinamidine synthase I [Elusimicrobiota bacterium]|nr:phosphoribosylformylglycinamidine synthase I [Elusimicrobiota bacterium]
MPKVKVIVLRAAGTNNDLETQAGFFLAGADRVDLIHINKLLTGEIKLQYYDILAIPGGFSYGDYISAGKIFANELKYKLKDEVEKFINLKKLVIGICNGFQVLVKAGFLPGNDAGKQTVSLTYNDSGKFECRWVYLKVKSENLKVKRLWIKNLPEIIQLPVAHAEGKFVASKKTITELEEKSLIVFKYCDENGNSASYPYNPNGSLNNIAGICNSDGNVLGLMPHPERFVSKFQYPSWTRASIPFGLRILQNAVEYVKSKVKH